MGLAEGSEILFFDSTFSGAFLLVLRVWLEAWAAWAGRGGCPGNLVFNSKFPQPHPVRLGWWGVGLAEGLYRLQLSGKGGAGQPAARTGGIRNSATLKKSTRTTIELQRTWGSGEHPCQTDGCFCLTAGGAGGGLRNFIFRF